MKEPSNILKHTASCEFSVSDITYYFGSKRWTANVYVKFSDALVMRGVIELEYDGPTSKEEVASNAVHKAARGEWSEPPEAVPKFGYPPQPESKTAP